MSYINETDFVIENKKLVYPEIVADGLQLYYDSKGKRDTDYHRDTMLDMSGNKNHGKLHNFAYEKHSGYKDGLVFDYIDDKLVRPTLDLKPDDFTFMLNGNIISFSPDGTVKRVQEGEVIESKGFNLVRNGDFVDERNGWNVSNITDTIKITKGIATVRAGKQYGGLAQNLHSSNKMPLAGDKYYFCANIERKSSNVHLYLNDGRSQTSAVGPNTGFVSNIRTLSDDPIALIVKLQDNNSVNWADSKISDVFVINLTETFGAGKEPTKEQMDEIINRFGFIPNAQDLINRIEYKGNDLGDMENIIDGLYKTEVLSGEEIYTDKADDDAVVHVEVDGKTVGGGENNLVSKRDIERWSGTITWSDHVMTVEADDKGLGGVRIPSGVFELNKKYTFNFKARLISGTVYGLAGHAGVFTTQGYQNDISLGLWHSSVASPQKALIVGEEYNYRINLTRKSSGDWFYIQPNRGNYTAPYKIELYDFQLNKGDYSFEYDGLSPTPDYPNEIHSLNDFDVVSSVGRENLLKDSKREWRTAREYVAPSYNLNEIFDKYPVGQTYTISFDAKSDDPSKRDTLQFYSNPGSTVQNKYMFATRLFTGLTTEYQRFSHTITPYLSADPSFPKSGMSFYGLYDTGNIPTIRNIKIELGTTATPYTISPKDLVGSDNQTSIDKINLLLYEPLRSVGNEKDRLFRDGDGVWKIERRIWVQVLDKNTTLNSSGAVSYEGTLSTSRYISPTKYILGHSTAMYELCTHLPHKNQVWSNDNLLFGTSVNGATQFHFRIPNSVTGVIPEDGVLTRSSKINDWLESEKNKGNPFTIQYIMRDPEIEILPQTLQYKLNNLRSFEDSNYVYTVDGSMNLLDTVPLLNSHWYPSSGTPQNPVTQNGHTSTQEPLPVYPGAKIHLTKETTVDNYWRIVWVDKDNNVVIREVSTVNDLILTAPSGAYGMRVSYPNGSNPVIKFDKSDENNNVSNKLKPTLHAKFLYNNWYKEDRVINNLMIYNRALTNEEMLQNYKTIKRRWGM